MLYSRSLLVIYFIYSSNWGAFSITVLWEIYLGALPPARALLGHLCTVFW